MARMDRENRRRYFHRLIAGKEHGSRVLAYNRHRLDDVPLRVKYPGEWEKLRENIIKYDDPREEYIFDCAERWGKMIQKAMDKRAGKAVSNVEFAQLVSHCRDFAFVLDEHTGKDLSMAVEFLKDNAEYGERIAAWHEGKLEGVVKYNGAIVNGYAYVEDSAVSRPDTLEVKAMRREMNERKRQGRGPDYKRARIELSVPEKVSPSARVRAVKINPTPTEKIIGWFARTMTANVGAAVWAVKHASTRIVKAARCLSPSLKTGLRL